MTIKKGSYAKIVTELCCVLENDFMGGLDSYYKGERKKLSKENLTKRAKKLGKTWELPRVEIISKKKDK